MVKTADEFLKELIGGLVLTNAELAGEIAKAQETIAEHEAVIEKLTREIAVLAYAKV